MTFKLIKDHENSPVFTKDACDEKRHSLMTLAHDLDFREYLFFIAEFPARAIRLVNYLDDSYCDFCVFL